MRRLETSVICLLVVCATLVTTSAGAVELPDPLAARKALGVDRGLIVQFGATDPGLAIALAKDPVVVHAIAGDGTGEERLRAAFVAAGVHGQITAGHLLRNGESSIVDNLASAVIADLSPPGLRKEEVLRVLRPQGKAYLKEGGSWQVVVKPRPSNIDDWRQYYHDAAMSERSSDTQAGPARGLQWQSPYSTSDVGVCIVNDLIVRQESAGLVARDAFNGLPIWRRPDVTSVTRYSLVADDEHLFVYNGTRQIALNLRTGATDFEVSEGLNVIRPSMEALKAAGDGDGYAWRDTFKDFEARLSDGVLVQCGGTGLAAVSAKTGKKLWIHQLEGAKWSMPLVDQGTVYVIKGQNAKSSSYTHWPMPLLQSVHAFDLKTGVQRWQWEWAKDMPAYLAANDKAWEHKVKNANFSPPEQREAVAIHQTKDGDRLVVLLRAELRTTRTGNGMLRQLVLNTKSGTREAYGPTPGYVEGKSSPTIGGGHSGARVFATGGRWWYTSIIGIFGSADPAAPTDSTKWTNPYAGFLRPVGCMVYRATSKYVFGSLTTYALDGTEVQQTNAARTVCDVGAFPANGLTYISSHGCHCLPYLPGSSTFQPQEVRPADDTDRLERGTTAPAPVPAASTDAWPMYLRDNLRSSWGTTVVPDGLQQLWTIRPVHSLENPMLGDDWASQWYGQGPVTGASVAEGIAVAALTDRQQILAMDPATGKERWRATVDGRVDSQPTIARGLVFAGTRNGYLYALNRESGALVWRFRAAPRHDRIVANGQIESVWPLFGTVTVTDDSVWAVAGRHNDTDGGLWWWRLDPQTGKTLSSGRFGKDALRNKIEGTSSLDFGDPAWPMGANSPLVTDGNMLLMPKIYTTIVDGKLQPVNLIPGAKNKYGRPTGATMRSVYEMTAASNLMVPGNYGLLCGDRGYVCEKKIGYGWVFARHMAYRDDQMVCVGGTDGSVAFRMGNSGLSRVTAMRKLKTPVEVPELHNARGAEQLWENLMPLTNPVDKGTPFPGVRTMAVSGEAVLVGLAVNEPRKAEEAKRMPYRLQVLAMADGTLRQELALPGAPIRGGLSAAGGLVYAASSDGSITCFGKPK